jgi:hypothetical protein
MLDGSMMALGFAFYCLLPFVTYGTDAYSGGPGEDMWKREFEGIYAASGPMVVLILIFVLAFLAGRVVPAPALGQRLNRPIAPSIIQAATLLLGLMWLLFAYQARDSLGAGYGVEYQPNLMGPLATVNLIATLMLLNLKQWKQSSAMAAWLAVLLLVNSLLLLSMGGRMYVLVALLCLLLQHVNTHARRPLARARLLILTVGALVALAGVGVWRLGLDFEPGLLLITALAEPILTSISLASYHACGDPQLLAVPYNFLGSIVNFVPSGLLPDKATLMPGLDPAENCMVSPFGATHLGPALLVNFGFVGSACFLALFAYLLKSFRNVAKNGWWFHYYLCGLLPFMFFRDGFLIFNKALFGSGLLVGAVLIFMGSARWMRKWHAGGRASLRAPSN